VTKSHVLDNFERMVREFSAGGVLVKRALEGWQMAVIEPQTDTPEGHSVPSRRKLTQKLLLALPKGLVDSGERPEQTALREVKEETGITAVLITKLGDVKYVYVRSWGDRERVFKIVSFYLLLYESGQIDDLSPDMRIEVKRAHWIPLEEATRRLKYRGEKEMVQRAREYLEEHPQLMSGEIVNGSV
jgi:8-oxo-dGTP pyrophosphatase MutT (NUDIX family)